MKPAVAIRKPEQQVHKASHYGSKQQWRWCTAFLLLLPVHATYIQVLFFAHIPFVVDPTFNAMPTERLQQHPLLLYNNHTNGMFFVWRLHLAQPSHPGHITILLRSESPSSKCAKLHNVQQTTTKTTHRDHSVTACSRLIYIYMCCSLRTFRSWWTVHSAQHQQGGCNNSKTVQWQSKCLPAIAKLVVVYVCYTLKCNLSALIPNFS